MVVLVTGAGGYLGSSLTSKLLENSLELCLQSRHELKPYTCENVLVGDLLNPVTTSWDLSNVTVLVNLAGKTLGSKSNNFEFIGHNFLTLVNLLKNPTLSPSLIIQASSQAVYGDPNKLDVSETYFLQPEFSDYALSKVLSENLVKRYCSKKNICGVNLRLPGFFRGGGAIDYVINQALDDNEIEIWGSGEVFREYISLDYFNSVIIALLKHKTMALETHVFNLGCINKMNLIDATNLLTSSLNSKSKLKIVDRSVPLQNLTLNSEKISEFLCLKQPDFLTELLKASNEK